MTKCLPVIMALTTVGTSCAAGEKRKRTTADAIASALELVDEIVEAKVAEPAQAGEPIQVTMTYCPASNDTKPLSDEQVKAIAGAPFCDFARERVNVIMVPVPKAQACREATEPRPRERCREAPDRPESAEECDFQQQLGLVKGIVAVEAVVSPQKSAPRCAVVAIRFAVARGRVPESKPILETEVQKMASRHFAGVSKNDVVVLMTPVFVREAASR